MVFCHTIADVLRRRIRLHIMPRIKAEMGGAMGRDGYAWTIYIRFETIRQKWFSVIEDKLALPQCCRAACCEFPCCMKVQQEPPIGAVHFHRQLKRVGGLDRKNCSIAKEQSGSILRGWYCSVRRRRDSDRPHTIAELYSIIDSEVKDEKASAMK